MQSLQRSSRGLAHAAGSTIGRLRSSKPFSSSVGPELSGAVPDCSPCGGGTAAQVRGYMFQLPVKQRYWSSPTLENTKPVRREFTPSCNTTIPFRMISENSSFRGIATVGHSEESFGQDISATSPSPEQPQRIKFKRLSKTAKHIMNILDKEAVEEVQTVRDIPDIRPGYIIQLKVEVPENKRRVSTLKGIVIARRNAGLHTTFRLRRLVAGVGVESVFPLYSPNIKEVKILDKKKVRRAKLYYLRDRMNPLKK